MCIAPCAGQLLHDESLLGLVREWERKERGSLPSYVETCIIVWQAGHAAVRDFSIMQWDHEGGQINLVDVSCPTIATFLNCVGTRSSEAKNRLKDHKKTAKFKI